MKLVNNIAALGRCFISDQFDNILKIFKNAALEDDKSMKFSFKWTFN